MNQPRFSTTPPLAHCPDNFSVDAAGMNLNWEWAAECAKWAGISIVAIGFHSSHVEEILHLAGPGFERTISDELKSAGIGQMDSQQRGERFYAFFHVRGDKQMEAVALIQSTLEALKIIRLVGIAIADVETKKWRDFHG